MLSVNIISDVLFLGPPTLHRVNKPLWQMWTTRCCQVVISCICTAIVKYNNSKEVAVQGRLAPNHWKNHGSRAASGPPVHFSTPHCSLGSVTNSGRDSALLGIPEIH
jgi:hypothetical protein